MNVIALPPTYIPIPDTVAEPQTNYSVVWAPYLVTWR